MIGAMRAAVFIAATYTFLITFLF